MPLWKDNHHNDLTLSSSPFLSLSSPEYAPSTLYCPSLYSESSLHPYSPMSLSSSPLFLPPTQHHPYGKTGDHSIRCELLTPNEHSKASFWLQINTPKPAPDTIWTLPRQLLTSTEHFKVSCWLQLNTLKQTPDSKLTLLCKLQALVYDILPSTTAVFSYTIGPRKLSANEQFVCWCSNSSKFVTNNSDYIRHLFYVAMLLMPAQIKPKLFETRWNFFLPRMDASHVYVRAWVLGCFHSLISTQTFQRALMCQWTAAWR